jgi:hypothetical protein
MSKKKKKNKITYYNNQDYQEAQERQVAKNVTSFQNAQR